MTLPIALALLVGCAQTGTPDRGPAKATAPIAETASPETVAKPDADSAPAFPREPSAAEPVVAVGTVAPARIRPCDSFTLAIHVKTAPPWHIYPHDCVGTTSLPTSLALELPSGIEAAGDWRHPAPHQDPTSHVAILEGQFAFRRELRAGAALAAGAYELVCTIDYQTCDPFMCRPPAQITVRVPLEVVARADR